MTQQIFIGLFTEGKTDSRFLESIVKRTFEQVAFESKGDFEIYPLLLAPGKAGLSFTEKVLEVSKKGVLECGITVLCLHRDADDENDLMVMNNSITPALNRLQSMDSGAYCKTVAVIIPVQMTEAWLLADKELFKQEIGTTKTDQELGINRHPETIARPKDVIKEAIRLSRLQTTRHRRKNLTINEIYMPLGQKISIERLSALPSFVKFLESVKAAFRQLNYLQ